MSDEKRNFGATVVQVCGGLVLVLALLALVVLSFERAHAAGRWVLMGDDIGTTVREQNTVPDPNNVLAAQLQRKTGIQVDNMPLGPVGWQLMSTKLESAILAVKGTGAEGIIIFLGSHDWATGQNLGQIDLRVRARIAEAKAAGLKVVCVTPIHRTRETERHGPNPGQLSAKGNPLITNPANPGVRGYDQYISYYCSTQGAAVIHGHGSNLESAAFWGDLYGLQVHLNGVGHEALANYIISKMRLLGYW